MVEEGCLQGRTVVPHHVRCDRLEDAYRHATGLADAAHRLVLLLGVAGRGETGPILHIMEVVRYHVECAFFHLTELQHEVESHG